MSVMNSYLVWFCMTSTEDGYIVKQPTSRLT